MKMSFVFKLWGLITLAMLNMCLMYILRLVGLRKLSGSVARQTACLCSYISEQNHG